MFTNIKARVITKKMGNYIETLRRLKQGDSFILFIHVFEQLFRLQNWNNKEILVGGERLSSG